jgi:hypothetical protein
MRVYNQHVHGFEHLPYMVKNLALGDEPGITKRSFACCERVGVGDEKSRPVGGKVGSCGVKRGVMGFKKTANGSKLYPLSSQIYFGTYRSYGRLRFQADWEQSLWKYVS